MRSVIDHYVVDRGSLSRFYNIEQSKAYRDRLGGFFEQQSKRLEDVDFDALDQAGRIDYLLLRAELRRKLTELGHERQQGEEVAWLLPFAEPIARMEESRRRAGPADGEECARTLTKLSDELAKLRKQLDNSGGGPCAGRGAAGGPTTRPSVTPVQANRAARMTDELRDVLRHWYRFYDGYNPTFTWWVRQPYEKADKDLEAYAGFLRKRLAGFPDEADSSSAASDRTDPADRPSRRGRRAGPWRSRGRRG